MISTCPSCGEGFYYSPQEFDYNFVGGEIYTKFYCPDCEQEFTFVFKYNRVEDIDGNTLIGEDYD